MDRADGIEVVDDAEPESVATYCVRVYALGEAVIPALHAMSWHIIGQVIQTLLSEGREEGVVVQASHDEQHVVIRRVE